MNIAIITVYHPFTNLGSFLQAYALKLFLEEHGHKVSFARTAPHYKSAVKLIRRVRPYRSYLLRIKKFFHSLRDLKRLSYIDQNDESIDCYLWGSDEIWNVTNRFFCRPIFFGTEIKNKPKIGYAISVGHAVKKDFMDIFSLTDGVIDFDRIFSRDPHTKHLLKRCFDIDTELVADPTLLVNVSRLSEKIRLPKRKYLLIYTYGIDNDMIKVVKEFSAKHGLQIISPCFWHIWADKTIECSALQFSTLVSNAEFVFTTTFHGAIFSLINHTRCCILPIRPKVRSICETLKCDDRLIPQDCELAEFERIISKPFAVKDFEVNLANLRKQSSSLLISELNRIEYEKYH